MTKKKLSIVQLRAIVSDHCAALPNSDEVDWPSAGDERDYLYLIRDMLRYGGSDV